MLRYFRPCLGAISLFLLPAGFPTQAPDAVTAPLREVHADGEKLLNEAQIIAITGLVTGAQIGRNDLEAPRIPVYFDNIPWFLDSELGNAIRNKFPFFDGTLPEAGAVVDQASEAVRDLLSARGLQVSLEHTVIANPSGEGNVQEIMVEGAALQIAKLEFGDPSLAAAKTVQQHLSEILGKPYSRVTIDLFLSEAIRPIYLQQGFLRAKLGPPEVRLTGDPNQKLPSQIPVYVPIASGAVYRWRDIHWTGNTLVSAFTLDGLLGIKQGEIADGMQIEAGWDRARGIRSSRLSGSKA